MLEWTRCSISSGSAGSTASATRARCPAGSASASPSRGRSCSIRSSSFSDESVSSLDVSIQAQVLNLLRDLQAKPRAHLPVHQPRPRRRPVHGAAPGGDAERQDRGAGYERAAVQLAAASVHPQAARGHPGSGPGRRARPTGRGSSSRRWPRQARAPWRRDHDQARGRRDRRGRAASVGRSDRSSLRTATRSSPQTGTRGARRVPRSSG